MATTRHYCSGWAFVLLLAAAVALAGCGNDSGKQKKRRVTPVPVAVKTVKPGTVDIYATYPGRIHGAREVEVHPLVSGILVRRHYNEGEFVEAGELLFTIKQDRFKAAVKQRKAQLAKAKANLQQAQEVWQRVSRLYEIDAVSAARYDEARAKLETARAAVQLAKAKLEAARIKLDHTTVEAPLSGVTSLEEVDVGSLVTRQTVLTTITQVDPVHVQFAVPAEDALMGPEPLAAVVRKDNTAKTRDVTLILPSGEVYEQEGFIDFTQSTIDPSTGTVHLRAVFDNSDRELVPGRFVRVRLRLATRHNVVVIPNKAIANSQVHTQVYIVTDDNRAKPVPVKLGPAIEGGRIIEQGLEAGDQVIIIGLGQVRAGSPVVIKPRKKLALGGQPFQGRQNAAASGKAAAETATGPASRQPGSTSAGDTNRQAE